MHSFFVDPGCFDVVVVQGQDAERFLQGQLTCDVENLTDCTQSYGTCCNNKGRVIAAFLIMHLGESFYLCMSKGVGPLFVGALRKFLPFYKCSMALADDRGIVALHGDAVEAAMTLANMPSGDCRIGQVIPTQDGWFCLIDGAEPRALWYCKTNSDEIAGILRYAPQGNELEMWEAMGMLAGHFPFSASDVERHTPQELHYDQNGYVSFSKGCYTGQEIVARMHYRGKHKKQLFLVVLRPADTSIKTLSLLDVDGSSLGDSLVIRKIDSLLLALVELPSSFVASAEGLRSSNGAVVAVHSFNRTVIQLATLASQ